MIRTRLALATVLCAAMVTPAVAQYKKDRKQTRVTAPWRADAWGPKQGRPGTRCWVNGQGFKRNMTVLVGGRKVALAKWAPQRIEFDIPRGGYGNGQIILRKPTYADIIVGTFKVMPDPAIRRFGPRGGAPGTRVEIIGAGFGPGIQVMMNGRALRADEINPGRIVFRVPDWARTDYITLAGDGYKIRSAGQFRVLSPAPIIGDVKPGFGAPGTRVRISGRHFDGREQVFYGRRKLRQVTYGQGWVEFVVPGWARRPQPLRVRNQYGESTWNGPFALRLPPIVRGFRPNYGGAGTEVTVIGDRFENGDYVTLGGARLPIVAITPRAITVKVDPRARSGAIAVHRGGLAVPARGAFTVERAPIIKSWAPKLGRVGTVVTIRGEGWNNRAQVFYGNRRVRPRKIAAGYIEVAVPPGLGPKRWRIVDRGGDVWTGKPFGLHVYPAVTGINPRWGGPGTELRVRGRFLKQAGTWFIGKTPCQVVSSSPTEVVLRIPPNARSGKIWWDAHGERLGGGYDFDVRYAPVVSALDPAYGPPGSLVTIRGQHFGGGRARVSWGPRRRLRVVKSGPGFLTVKLPPRIRGEEYLWVEHDGQRIKAPTKFRVVTPPRIRGLGPRRATYGESLTITGEGYGPNPIVKVGQKPARIVSRAPGKLVVEIPAGVAPGRRWVWVTADGSTARSPYQLTVPEPARISRVLDTRLWAGKTFIIDGDGFGPKIRVRVNGQWWPIKKRDPRGRRLWIEVPANQRPGRYWVEAVKAGGYVARSPVQVEYVVRERIRDKRRRYK